VETKRVLTLCMHLRYLLTRASLVRKGGRKLATAAQDFFLARESQLRTGPLSSQRLEDAAYTFDDHISDGLKAESTGAE
jgi:hypothetical protein